jgi:hypothetical protein
MPITTTAIANDILNRVAAEVGLAPVTDPYTSQDPSFVQMRYLLDTAGEELVQAYPWGLLVKEEAFTTVDGDDGDYPLPSDFSHMINQTGWDRGNNVPLMGPLSAQDWTYLKGRNLVSSTIYASFRLAEGLFKIFPNGTETPAGLDITYEYISKNWVKSGTSPFSEQDQVLKGSDTVLYDKTLVSRALKVKFLEAKGFDSSKAQADFNQIFSFLTGTDKGAKVLNAGGGASGYPYLDMWRNAPDTGYGL